MANDKLNTKEIFAGIKKEFWDDLATAIKLMIEQDMIAGEVQEYTTQTRPTKAGAKNYSSDYKQYKSNYMRRRTVGKAKDKTYTFDIAGDIKYKDLYFRNKKVKYTQKNPYGTGIHIKSYSGVSVIDNTTKSVNMRVTGKTIKGLHKEKVLSNGVILSYNPEDAYKIEYNAEMGRLITTLNDKNKDKVLNLYADALDVSLRKWAQKELVIKVGN